MTVEGLDTPLGLGCSLNGFPDGEKIWKIIKSLKDVSESDSERVLQECTTIISRYREQPHLMDSEIGTFLKFIFRIILNEKSDDLIRDRFAVLAVHLITVRGPKNILKYLPQESSDLPLVTSLLRSYSHRSGKWETEYSLLLALSVLVLAPFDLEKVFGSGLKESIYFILNFYVKSLTKAGDGATNFLAVKFLSRKDIVNDLLVLFIQEALKEITLGKYALGYLKALASLFKTGPKEILVPYADEIMEKLEPLSFISHDNSLVRKNYLKLAQRIVVSWLVREESRKDHESCMVENVIQELLDGIKDKETVVRWTAAKGIGRLAVQLPDDLGSEIVTSLVKSCTFREWDLTWHGTCLALAELARRGKISLESLRSVISTVVEALKYDERKGCFSVGSHVRDAACYVCWSLSKAYGSKALSPYGDILANSLLSVMLFDREITCRRAASAAFQEIVGRQGIFHSGIEILTKCDYFALGNRSTSFLELSLEVSKLPQYSKGLLEHLLYTKSFHWDAQIRELTGSSLQILCKIPSNRLILLNDALPYFFECIKKTTDVREQHGSVVCIGNILAGLADQGTNFSSTIWPNELHILTEFLITKLKNYFFGRELLQTGTLGLIRRCSEFKIPVDSDTQNAWKTLLEECLSSADPGVIEATVQCINPFFSSYFHEGTDGMVKSGQFESNKNSLISFYIENLSKTSEFSMGFSLAMGELPYFVLKGDLKKVIEGLIKTSQNKDIHAEARRNGVLALNKIVGTYSFQSCTEEMKSVLDLLFKAYTYGLSDYTIERRGDTGAWVREASMVGLVGISSYSLKIPSIAIDPFVEKFLPLIAKQAVEKIDRTRSLAAKTFHALSFHPAITPPDHVAVKKIFSGIPDDISWSSESQTFPIFVKLVSSPPYSVAVLEGLIFSIGSLTFSLMKNACGSLYEELETLNQPQAVQFLENVLSVLKTSSEKDRILVPFCGFLKTLVESGSIDETIFKLKSEDLFATLNEKRKKTRDPKKVISLIEAFSVTFEICDDFTKRKICKVLILFCVFSYPRVRKLASSKLYEILELTEAFEGCLAKTKLMDIIMNTSWDAQLAELSELKIKMNECVNGFN